MVSPVPIAEATPTGIWHIENTERFAAFRGFRNQTRFAAGEGLPGRVLGSGKPAWITDVTRRCELPARRGGG